MKEERILPDHATAWKHYISPWSGYKLVQMYDEYVDFMQQSLKLSDFIPCNDKGEPIEKPKGYENLLFHIQHDFDGMFDGMQDVKDKTLEYQQALERTIFEGFEIVDKFEHGRLSKYLLRYEEYYYRWDEEYQRLVIADTFYEHHGVIKSISDLVGKVSVRKEKWNELKLG